MRQRTLKVERLGRIDYAAALDLQKQTERAVLTGVHTDLGKVAAIGVHIARWITTHGFALNVNADLSYFDLIVACEGEPVTSMKELLGHEVEMKMVEDRIVERFAEVFEMEIIS